MSLSSHLPHRVKVLGLSVAAGIVFVAALSLLFVALGASDSVPAAILLDMKSAIFTYPFTIQNLMNVIFFVGLGELYVRWKVADHELGFAEHALLPEDKETVLQMHDLGSIRVKVADKFDGENGFLPSLIDLCILQFQSTRSVGQATSVLNSGLELIQHRVDLRYAFIRYITWVIPTIGFIGTVVGIAFSLLFAAENPENIDLARIMESLGVSFYTTLMALLLSAILVLLLHVVERREEMSVNLAGTYTLRNLINRLYIPRD